MTEIVAGEYLTNEQSQSSWGGTEQMAQRMVKYIDPELLKPFQIIHSRVRELNPDLKKILVCHDLHSDPEVKRLADPEYRKQFTKIVFVSNWQAQIYNLSLGIPYKEFVVIPNAIERFELKEKDYSGPIKLIYHTTPHRGLVILLPVIKELSKHHDVTLDVFSSFGVYGWEERDKPYEPLFKELKSLPNVTLHGAQPNSVVREKLQETHAFVYPSVWPETSCIAAMEALCAGNFVVHPNLAALPETCEHGTVMYQFTENLDDHANVFYNSLFSLCNLIRNQPDEMKSVAIRAASHYNTVYCWERVFQQWSNLLRALKDVKD